MNDHALDKLFAFYSVIAPTWSPDEVHAWGEYAQRVERGETNLRFPETLPLTADEVRRLCDLRS